MRILIDMDSVVVDLCSKWFSTYNEEAGDDLRMENVASWDTHLYIKGDPKHLYGILCRPGFYDSLPPLDGAVDAVTELAKAGHEIRFCTATPSADAARSKMEWVDREFAHLNWRGHKHVILTHEKHWIDANILIDDSPHNLEAFTRSSGFGSALAIAYPYNESFDGFRAHDWRDTRCAWSQILHQVKQASLPWGS